jgi:hypothetical protein
MIWVKFLWSASDFSTSLRRNRGRGVGPFSAGPSRRSVEGGAAGSATALGSGVVICDSAR